MAGGCWNCVHVKIDETDLSIDERPDRESFSAVLSSALKDWEQDNIKGVWLRISEVLPEIIAEAVSRPEFTFHHAQPGYCMLTAWLPKDVPNTLPSYCVAHLGVGGLVVNSKR